SRHDGLAVAQVEGEIVVEAERLRLRAGDARVGDVAFGVLPVFPGGNDEGRVMPFQDRVSHRVVEGGRIVGGIGWKARFGDDTFRVDDDFHAHVHVWQTKGNHIGRVLRRQVFHSAGDRVRLFGAKLVVFRTLFVDGAVVHIRAHGVRTRAKQHYG